MKSRFIIIGSIVVLVLIIAGVVYFAGNNPFTVESPTKVKPPSGQPALTEEPSSPVGNKSPTGPSPLTLEQRIESLKKAVAEVCTTGERKEVALVITETEANNRAAELMATAQIPADIPLEIESVHLDFRPDNTVGVEAQSVLYGKFKATIRATAQVNIKDGELKVEIAKINFGFIPVPQSLRDRIASLVAEKLDELKSQLIEAESGCNGKVTLEFKDISIRHEDLTVTVVIERNSPTIP